MTVFSLSSDLVPQTGRTLSVIMSAASTKIQEDVADRLIIIPRVYTNKPRTTGEGYKGIASQPDPEKAPDMIEGLIAMRKNAHPCELKRAV